jgi:AraC-like DNA-binding protein
MRDLPLPQPRRRPASHRHHHHRHRHEGTATAARQRPGPQPPQNIPHLGPRRPTRRDLVTALITSQPPRDWSGTELAAQLNIPSRHLHTQLGEWTRWGFFTRTGFGTYRLNTPPAATSSTTQPDP